MGKLNVVVLFDRWDEPEVESTSTEKAPLTRTLDKKEVEDEVADTLGKLGHDAALLQQTAIAVYQALELRDYARIDMRLRPDGQVAVIEANPNPWLASKAEFAMAARKSGRNYTQLIEAILDLAMARYA